jgi:butyrate kinase
MRKSIKMSEPGINTAEGLAQPCILTINGGSSSIKFALYQTVEPLASRKARRSVGGREGNELLHAYRDLD